MKASTYKAAEAKVSSAGPIKSATVYYNQLSNRARQSAVLKMARAHEKIEVFAGNGPETPTCDLCSFGNDSEPPTQSNNNTTLICFHEEAVTQ